MPVQIYGLVCPIDGSIRYIGKSKNPKRRLSAHISSAARNVYDHHASRWIRKLAALGLVPRLEILQAVQDGEDWRECERSWIAKGISEGWPLTNSTVGGEGLDYLCPEAEAKYKANLSASMKRYFSTPEGRKAMTRFMESSRSPGAKAARRKSLSDAGKDPSFIERMREIGFEIGSRPEVKRAKSAKAMAMWADPEQRGRIEQALRLPECKAKQSEARKAAWADPIIGAKLRELHNSDEVRANKSASAKARATPEYRAMMAEKTRLSWEKRRKAKST